MARGYTYYLVAAFLVSLGLGTIGSCGDTATVGDVTSAELTGGDAGGDAQTPGDVGAEDLTDLSTLDAPASDSADTAGACEEGMGCFGDPCTDADSCHSGFCIPSRNGWVCTSGCEGSCPIGWRCQLLHQAGSDPVFLCLDGTLNLCRPCEADVDCQGVVEGTGNRCVASDDGSGSFCGLNCLGGDECPEDYTCKDYNHPRTSQPLKQCMPETGTCSCSQWAIDMGAATSCGNEYCPGYRYCGPEGLTECDAQVSSEEICDGKDNDCDGQIDEDTETALCGVGGCAHEVVNCVDGILQECDPLLGSTAEVCDALDNDCDGATDEDLGEQLCGLGACAQTLPVCSDGSLQTCDPVGEATPETCDGLDNDCNGEVDDGLAPISCGVGVCKKTVPSCVGGAPSLCDDLAGVSPEACDGLDNDCDGETDEGFLPVTCGTGVCMKTVPSCADGKPNPCDAWGGALPEICDGLDNDCDGDTDEDLGTITCWLGPCQTQIDSCSGGKLQGCGPVEGASPEVCDGVDNDCDGTADEDLPSVSCGVGACAKTVQSCVGGLSQVCDKDEGASDEVCDNVDNDCDGDTDEIDAIGCIDFYLDIDGDGWGRAEIPPVCLCQVDPTSLYTAVQKGDCADFDPAINPDADETCNGIDDDCDGIIPPEELDADNDGLSGCQGDCVNDDPTIYPGAPDPYGDGIDQDCDGADGPAGQAPIAVTVTIGGTPVEGVPVVTLLVPGDLPTGNVGLTDANGQVTFGLIDGLTYTFQAVLGDVKSVSGAVTAPGFAQIAFPDLIDFQVQLVSEGSPQEGIVIEALRHDIDPATGKEIDTPLNVSKTTDADGLVPYTLAAHPDGFRFRATVFGITFTSEIVHPQPDDVFVFEVGAFNNVTVTLLSGENDGKVGSTLVQADRIVVDPATGVVTYEQVAETLTSKDEGVVAFDLPASPDGYRFRVPDLFGYAFVSDMVPEETENYTFKLPGFSEVTVHILSAGTPVGGVGVDVLNHRELPGGVQEGQDLWDSSFTFLVDGTVTFIVVDNAAYGQPEGGWLGLGYLFRVADLYGKSFTTEKAFVAPQYSYPPAVDAVFFEVGGFSSTKLTLHHGGVPITGVAVQPYRVSEHGPTGTRKVEAWAPSKITDVNGQIEVTMAAVDSQLPADYSAVGIVWSAPNIEGWSFVSHSQSPLWCTDCPPGAGGALNPHFFQPGVGYPPVEQEDTFEIVGFAEITVEMTSTGVPVAFKELRAYRMKEQVGGGTASSDHWLTETTDAEGKVTFVVPDPSLYGTHEGWTYPGSLFWYAPNVEGWGLHSHTHTNHYCPNKDCPPSAGGAIEPHFYTPQVGYPPIPQNDTFKTVGFAEITVTLTSAGVPVPFEELRIYRMKELIGGGTASSDHWQTRTTDLSGNATFTVPDPKVYGTNDTYAYPGTFFWYATNVEGWGLHSHTHTNHYCPNKDCPPSAGGALEPHFYTPQVGYPPTPQNDTFKAVGFAEITVNMTSAGVPVPFEELRIYRMKELIGGGKASSDHWQTRTTDLSGNATFTVPDPKVYSTNDTYTYPGTFFWYATNVEGWGLHSHTHTNHYCPNKDCPPSAGGALEPHFYTAQVGFPPTPQNDTFKAVGFAEITVKMTAGGSPVPFEELRIYRMKELVGGGNASSDHWQTRTTDLSGDATFTVPDPKVYGTNEDYAYPGTFFWYATNVEGWGLHSHTHTNHYCPSKDCPPSAGGALEPHFYTAQVGFPPTPQNDTFKAVGFARLNVSISENYNNKEMRVYRVKNSGQDHWQSRTIKKGLAIFTVPDYAVYSLGTGQSGSGFKFYLSPTGQYTGQHSGMPFGFPPIDSNYNF